MDKGSDIEKDETFLEILKHKENSNPRIDQKVLFITTDCWLAQLGPRKSS